MSGSRFFRGLSRVNSVLLFLFLASLVVTLVVVLMQETTNIKKSSAPSEKTVFVEDKDTTLQFERAAVAHDTGVVRVDLVAKAEGKGMGSSGYSRVVRNVLFIPADGTPAHWLLQNNNDRISDPVEVVEFPAREESRSVASAVIVTPSDASDNAPGKALLFDPSGQRITEITTAATSIEVAELTKTDIIVIYRNGERFFRATFAPDSLAKRSETQVQVPKLK